MFFGTKAFFIFGAPEPLSQGVRYPRALALGEWAASADIRPYAASEKQQSEAQSEDLLHFQTPHWADRRCWVCLLDSEGFSFAFTGPGEVLRAPFSRLPSGTADAAGATNLAAHRCSHFL
jgi:hypothetical protein